MEWDSQRDVKKIIIFHFINYIFFCFFSLLFSSWILWTDLCRMAVEEKIGEVFSLAHQALLIYLFYFFLDRETEHLRSEDIVTENVEQSFHSVSFIYFSISTLSRKQFFFVELKSSAWLAALLAHSILLNIFHQIDFIWQFITIKQQFVNSKNFFSSSSKQSLCSPTVSREHRRIKANHFWFFWNELFVFGW